MDFKEYLNADTNSISITRNNERTFSVLVSMPYSRSNHDVKCEAISYVYTHALLSGCGTYTRTQFLDAVSLIGASINVTASDGMVTISFSSLDTHQMKLQALVKTMIGSPTFTSTEIKRIKELVTNELIESKEDAKMRSLEALENVLYTQNDSRYTFNTDVLIKEIENVEKKSLQEFHINVLNSKWISTFISDTKYKQKIQNFINTLQKLSSRENSMGSNFPMNIEARILTKKVVELVSIPSKQNIEINIGNSLPLTQDDKNYYAFVFGLNVLGKWGGFAGRLMSTVREKEGLTYGIYAKTETTSRKRSGYWRIMTFFAPDKVLQGIASTLREIELIRTKGITQSEFDRFKTILETGEAMRGDSLQSTLRYHHGLQLAGFDLEGITVRRTKFSTLTRIEINQALKKYLDTSKLVISCAGPTASKTKELMKLQLHKST